MGDLDRIEKPDVEIGAAVRAKKLRFRRVPETEVAFTGDSERDQVASSERENLPDQVEPGVTCRDVRVRWRAAAKLRNAREEDEG
jgi:hypothetical protein